VDDWLTYAVPRRAIAIWILYILQQQFLLVGFMIVFTGAFPPLILHTILFVLGDYMFYKNLEKLLK
jgi:hypothetical protein